MSPFLTFVLADQLHLGGSFYSWFSSVLAFLPPTLCVGGVQRLSHHAGVCILVTTAVVVSPAVGSCLLTSPHLRQSARAAIQNAADQVAPTEVYVLLVLETGSPRSRCPQVWFLLSSLSLAGWWPPSCCCFIWSSLCRQSSSSCKDTSQVGLGPTHTGPLELDHLCTGPVSKYIHFRMSWGMGLQHMNWGVGRKCRPAPNTI